MIMYKVEFEGQFVGFVERESPEYKQKTLSEARKDLQSEIGELLPTKFRFRFREMPVSSQQELSTSVGKCVTEDGKDCYVFSIQKLSEREDPTSVITNTTIRPNSTNAGSIDMASSTDASNKPFEKTIDHAKREAETLEDDLQVAKALLASLEQAPDSRPWHGRANFTCKNCHFKGHKVSKPCGMQPCSGFNECGILAMHPEQKQEINKAKQTVKKLSKKLKEKQDELESIQLIKGRTKANFFSIMRPKLTSADPIKYSNRQTLENDLRILAAACSHIVPSPDKDLEEIIRKKKEESIRHKSSTYKEELPRRELQYGSHYYNYKQSSSSESTSYRSSTKRKYSDHRDKTDKGYQWRRGLDQEYTKSPSRSSHSRTSHLENTKKQHVQSSNRIRSYSPTAYLSPPRSTNTNSRTSRTYYSPSTNKHNTSTEWFHSPVAYSTPKHHSSLNSSRDFHSSSLNIISPSPAKTARVETNFDDSLPLFTDSYSVYTANTKEAANVLVSLSKKNVF